MDKVQKFEQTQAIETYLEKNQVRELFLSLMKQLLVNKPDKPLDFLIEKLSNPLVKRILLLGPAGSNKTYIASEIAKSCKDFVQIDIRELIQDEYGKGLQYKD